MTESKELPIARCLENEVEAWEFPFFIKKGVGMEPDFLLLEIHLYHMTSEEKAVMGELIEVKSAEQLEKLGYTVDDRGIFVIGEENVHWMSYSGD
ncbi:MAG: hypothetical protein ACC669_04110 [bacterium]